MSYKGIFFGNGILDIVFVAWFIAQGYKVISSVFKEKKLNFKRFIETGGMPSSHTASVVSLLTAIGIKNGISSTEFAITFVFAMIVMYDSSGVRRAAGKQASVLNRIVDDLWKKDGKRIMENDLKELLGHTPVEVFAGAILGVVVAFIMS
ncbi:divergent PAP2 family protein [Haliovirga abyssi]|uniref:Membrane protein n=1 Tax=Haliovirga abyssi TaxID=2996794 RepID=A0AAU9DCM0_9FUSO|nr:divergent PAP2 family protein [Haliovirga abyssi]BDU49898.1 membrane protein [Haliovirga abyssi]